jgi:Holliday junction resolvase-like predicted endonuclease
LTITVTETPRLHSSERSTWQALIDQLEPNDLVVPGQRVTDHLKDHELDFVVAIEGAGIVCVEVKGGDGWWQKLGGRDKQIEPVRQAREACYALRDFIEKDPRWTQGRLRWDHVIVLPHTELPDDFDLPDCPAGRSSTAPSCRTSSTSCERSWSGRSSNGRYSASRVSPRSQRR